MASRNAVCFLRLVTHRRCSFSQAEIANYAIYTPGVISHDIFSPGLIGISVLLATALKKLKSMQSSIHNNRFFAEAAQ